MRFHRTSKLLNKGTYNAGYLQLYTELDHTFQVGDQIYITGGHYDNVSNFLYSSQWNSSNNPFFTTTITTSVAYTITEVDYAINSVTINYPVPVALISPYGTFNNKAGDPTLTFPITFLAYNT